MKIPQKYLGRQAEITESFIREMNKHMDDFMAGHAEQMIHIKDFAGIMCLHPVHISNVIKFVYRASSLLFLRKKNHAGGQNPAC